jgi:hypothetical protein
MANTTVQFQAEYGCENDGTMGSGNVYTYNHFGAAAAGFIGWGHGVTKATYALFDTAYGSATSSLTSDPLFVNPTTDFHLQPSSPAINAGVDVGLTGDYEGKPIRGVPDIGAYETGKPGRRFLLFGVN